MLTLNGYPTCTTSSATTKLTTTTVAAGRVNSPSSRRIPVPNWPYADK